MQAKLAKPIWFDMKRYGSARTFGFQEWAVQIGNRIHLQSLLDASMLTVEQINAKMVDSGLPEMTEVEAKALSATSQMQFDELFSQLQSNPFHDLGFKVTYPSSKTIYPLTLGVAKEIVSVLTNAGCNDKEFCDEKLLALNPDMFGKQAHLIVDLRAPAPLIVGQFKKWIKEIEIQRDRGAYSETILQTWSVTSPILPYQDLRMWFLRQHGEIPSDGEFAKAHWFKSDASKDTIRPIRDWANRAFSIDTYHDLIQAEAK